MIQLQAYLFGVSLALTLLLVPLGMRLARAWGVIDLPGLRKTHAEPTPLSGGWVIFAAFSLVLWGHLGLAYAIHGGALEKSVPDEAKRFLNHVPDLVLRVLPVYAGAVAIFLLGLFDDVRGLSARARFMIQLVLATALALGGFRPDLAFLPSWLAAAVGVVWIVGITNAFNFLDGLDGLSAGVALVAAGVLLTIMGMSSQPDWGFFLASLAGCLVGFLWFNRPPARVFLGSSGSLLIGYLLAMATLMLTYTPPARQNWMFPILTPVFILAIPIYDTTSVVLIRLLQKRHVAIGDQSHFHHRLMGMGFSRKQAAGFIILMAAAIALSGVRLVDASLQASLIIFAQIMVLLSILVLAERVAGRVLSRARPTADAQITDVEPPTLPTAGKR